MPYNKDKFITKCYRLMTMYASERAMCDAIQDIIDRANNETVTIVNIKWVDALFNASRA